MNPPGDEIAAARYVAEVLDDAGLRPEVFEPFPGRGSVAARLHGDGSGGEPLLLLSHLDVVPAPADGWTHDPFAGDVADGYVWGRGAVDMKAIVAMQLAVVRLLADETRATRRQPADDPVPGLRRDVLIVATADEEAGGFQGAGWLAEHRPELLRAAGALTEAGGVSTMLAGRRFYPIQVAEKGFCVVRATVHGTWGHGSMPRDDNAAVRAAAVVAAVAPAGPARPTPVMRRFIDGVAAAVGEGAASRARAILDPDPEVAEAAIDATCDPMYARATRALLRDTMSPNVVVAGVKYNVIPGVAEVQIDARTLPGTTDDDVLATIRSRLVEPLAAACDLEVVASGPPVESPAEGELFDRLVTALRDHDPDGVPLPVMAPFATDAKHTTRLGVPTYGFGPLRLEPGERFLERFHGVDERVSLDAVRFGLPVLYDVVRGFCG